MNLRPLTPIEARVLGTLVEKARTVPDSYPLSLNQVVTGCNQKSNRDPVMEISPAEAQEALDELRALSLVIESHGSRVARYEHNARRYLDLPEQSIVLLGLLMLRGPQTAGGLRINAERWYRFADISSVEGFLNELAERSQDEGGPLTVQLPRAPGAREARWVHLLCGPVAVDDPALQASSSDKAAAGDAQTQRIDKLEAELAQLQATVARLCAATGVTAAPDVSPAGRPDTFQDATKEG